MTERPTNEEREALIAGDRVGALDPAEAAEVAFLAELLADPSTWAEPDASLEDAVLRAVAGAEPESAPVIPIESSRRRKAVSRRPRWVLPAVAAAAAIAIVGGAVVATRPDPKTDFTAQLSATALSPGAHASAEIVRNDAGFKVVLDASGLPPLQNGEFYQAWLKNASGTLVPIGSFSSSDGRVTLWSGVSPRDFPTLTVTIEAADNQQDTSGHRVLVGPVVAR